MLNIQNLTKRYGSKTAVDNLSLHIEAGEICAFIGHNGAGKTTTLKACCGLLTPDGGAITVDGMSIRERPIDCKRVMAYIPDNPDMYEFLTVMSTSILSPTFTAFQRPTASGASRSSASCSASPRRSAARSPSARTA